MATPGAVRVAVAASVFFTGGAAYYYLSDGGNPEKLEQNLSDTTAILSQTATKLGDASTQLKQTVTTWKESIASGKNDENSESISDDSEGNPPEAIAELPTPAEKQPIRDGFCHTCSGPRIWFFAEKLRLKRRFTPYPDPPRD